MRLTNLGKMFLALFVFFYWGALRTDSGLLFLILGATIGAFLMDARGVFLAARGCKVRIDKKPLFEEGKISLPLRITSPSLLPSLRIFTSWGNSLRVFSIKEKTIFLDKNFRRGIYSFHDSIIEHFGSLGLISFRKKLKIDRELIVTPKTFLVDSPLTGGLKSVVGGKGNGSSSSRVGDNLRSLRPYYPGDPSRQIHWPATAKRGELMIKEFDEGMAGYVTLWLDVHPGASSNSRDLLDSACRMAASLALSALKEKHQVRFIVWGKEKIFNVDCFLGPDEMLEELAKVKFKVSSGFSAVAKEILRKLPLSSSHNFIILNSREEIIDFASELAWERKKVSVYLPLLEMEKLEEKEGVFFTPFNEMCLGN